jgi:hypothetical protein
VALVSVKSVIENVLEEACALACLDGISGHRLKIRIGSACGEHLDLPFAFKIRRISVGIDFHGQVVDSRILSLARKVEQRRRGHCFSRSQQNLFRGLVEIQHRTCVATHDFKLILVVAAGADEASELDAEVGSPLLFIKETTYDDQNVPIEYSVSLLRGNRYTASVISVRKRTEGPTFST